MLSPIAAIVRDQRCGAHTSPNWLSSAIETLSTLRVAAGHSRIVAQTCFRETAGGKVKRDESRR